MKLSPLNILFPGQLLAVNPPKMVHLINGVLLLMLKSYNMRENPEAMRSFQSYISNANPDTLAAMGAEGMLPDMIKMATNMISKMKPEELQKMLYVASLNSRGPSFPTTSSTNGPVFNPQIPGMTPEMVKMTSDRIGKMSPDELQKMAEVASSMHTSGTPFPSSSNTNGDGPMFSPQIPGMIPEMVKMASDRISKMSAEELRKMAEVASSMHTSGTPFPEVATDVSVHISETGPESSVAAGCATMGNLDAGESSSAGLFSSSRMGQ